MAVDGKVIYKVEYDTEKATKNIANVSKSLKDVSEKAGSLGDTLNKKVTAPILAIGTATLAGFMKISGELDEIGKTAAGINSTAEGLQALQFAGRKAGIESDKMADTLKKIQEVTTSNAEAFSEFGIKTRDLNGEILSSDQIFKNITERLSGMTQAQRNATLLALGFTEELTTMNKVMDDSNGFLANMEKGMDNAIKDEQIQKFEEFNDRLEDIKGLLIPIAVDIADQLLPHLEELADWFASDGVESVGEFVEMMVKLIDKNKDLIAILAIAGPALKTFSAIANVAAAAGARAAAVGGATAAAGGASVAGGAAVGGGAVAGGATGLLASPAALGVAGVASILPAAAITVKGKWGETFDKMESDIDNLKGFFKLSPSERKEMAFGTSQTVPAVGNTGTVNIAKIENNVSTELSPENVPDIMDEVMRGVADELTMRQVFGK